MHIWRVCVRVQSMKGHRGEVLAIDWSGDSQYIRSGSSLYESLLWEPHSGQRVRACMCSPYLPSLNYLQPIDKLCTQMVKVNRRRNRVEPFAALFFAHGIIHTVYLQTPDPACRPGITAPAYTKHVLRWS